MKEKPLSISGFIWLFIFVTTFTLTILVGCGGGGGGGSAGALAAKGKVTLPPGFKLPLTQLIVQADSGQVPVNPDGTFLAPVATTGSRMIQLIDKVSSKTVLLGYVDASSSGSSFSNGAGAIDAKTTADALLFVGTQGFTLLPKQWGDYMTSIVGSTYETQLAATISTQVAALPTAIGDGDSTIMTALAAVQNSFVQPSPPPAQIPTAKPRSTVQRVTVTKNDITGALVKVEPVTSQSTLYIQPNPAGDGIVAVSTSRRRGAIFIYKVATGPDSTHLKAINPPIETFADVEIEPTLEIHNLKTTIVNGLLGQFAYLPLTNEPINLQPDPIDKIAVYDVVAIGPGPTDTIFAAEDAVTTNTTGFKDQMGKEWTTALVKSEIKFLFKDVVCPLFEEFVMSNLEAEEVEADPVLEASVADIASSAPGFSVAILKRDIKAASAAFLEALRSNAGGVKTRFIAAIAKSLVSSGKVRPEKFQAAVSAGLNSASNCFALMLAANKAIAVVDITQAFHDNTTYNTADVWVADVLQPVVTLSPIKSSVDTNDPLVHMKVLVQNITDLSPYRFQWTCTNNEGVLESSSSTALLGTGIIPDSTAVYTTDFTKFAVGTVDTVTVTMYDQNDLNTPIGSATATVKGAPGPCTTTPPPPTSFGANPAVITLSEPATRPGDNFTVTVSWPADGARTQEMEVTLFSQNQDFSSQANSHEAAKLISVDGVAAKSDWKDIWFDFSKSGTYNAITYPTPDTTAAQTHTLVFQMLEPTDSFANAVPYCSLKGSNGSGGAPYVVVSNYGQNGGIGSSTIYFNENP